MPLLLVPRRGLRALGSMALVVGRTLSLIAIPVFAPVAHAQTASVRLANGMNAIVVVDRTRPEVATSLTYSVGLRDDPPGYAGLAHVAEHCMFEGSRKVGPRGHARALEEAGATYVNALTSPDFTSFVTVAPSGALARMLWLEAERMAYVLERLDASALERVREAIRHETDERQAWPSLIMRSILPAGHPETVEGSAGLTSIQLDDVRWFIQRSYRPDRALLVVIGDLDPKATIASIRRYFGSIRAHPAEPRREAPPVVITESKTAHWAVPFAPAPLYVVWSTPAFLEPFDAALGVVGQMLERELTRVLPPKQASAARVTLHSGQRSSMLMVSLFNREGTTTEQFLEVVDGAIGRVCSGETGEDDFTAERAHFAYEAEHKGLLARTLYVSRYPDAAVADPVIAGARYASIQPAQALTACRKFLMEGPRLIVDATSRADAPPTGVRIDGPGQEPAK